MRATHVLSALLLAVLGQLALALIIALVGPLPTGMLVPAFIAATLAPVIGYRAGYLAPRVPAIA